LLVEGDEDEISERPTGDGIDGDAGEDESADRAAGGALAEDVDGEDRGYAAGEGADRHRDGSGRG
jgi:hypothetical protein